MYFLSLRNIIDSSSNLISLKYSNCPRNNRIKFRLICFHDMGYMYSLSKFLFLLHLMFALNVSMIAMIYLIFFFLLGIHLRFYSSPFFHSPLNPPNINSQSSTVFFLLYIDIYLQLLYYYILKYTLSCFGKYYFF